MKKVEFEVNKEVVSNRFRVGLTMSDEMVEFYQKLADSMGIPRSTAMVMALKTYMDQQEMLEFSKHIPKDY